MADLEVQVSAGLRATFAVWIDPLSNIKPPTVLVGAGLSYGLVPTADQYGKEVGSRRHEIESALGIVASTPPTDAGSLYQWAEECIAALVQTGHSEVSAKLVLAQKMGLTTDSRFLSKAQVPSRGTTPRHRVLSRLAREGRIESFWSFNWDCWLESSLESVGLRSGLSPIPKLIAPHDWKLRYVVWVSGAAFALRTDTMPVFKAHGCVRALFESKGEFVIAANEMARPMDQQPTARTTRMRVEVAYRPLVAIGWSATEGYVKELLAESGAAGVLTEGLTIVDVNCSQPGHLEVCTSYQVDPDLAAVPVGTASPGNADELMLWIQTLRGLNALQASCEEHPDLKNVAKNCVDATPKFTDLNLSGCGIVSFVDTWLPAWLRICFHSRAQSHQLTNGNELDVLPTEERDAHIPWAPLAGRRDDLITATVVLQAMNLESAEWNFEAFPGALWKPSTQELVVPFPAWADETAISSLLLRPLISQWHDQSRISAVRLLPINAPDIAVAPEDYGVRVQRWREAFADCFGRFYLAAPDSYKEVEIAWLSA